MSIVISTYDYVQPYLLCPMIPQVGVPERVPYKGLGVSSSEVSGFEKLDHPVRFKGLGFREHSERSAATHVKALKQKP